MKIYQNSTEMEANDLKIYQKQKISGNLKKLQQKFMKSFVRTCDLNFEGYFCRKLYNASTTQLIGAHFKKIWIQDFFLFIILM